MGEYAMKNGDALCKLGTADDFGYVRRSEVERLAAGQCDNSDEIRSALREPSILYRFPWPFEDAHEHDLSHINEREMRRPVVLFVPDLSTVQHGTVCHSMHAPGGGHQMNVFHPCPFDAKFADAVKSGGVSHSPMAKPFAVIAGERYNEHGQARTILECGYCRTPFSVGTEDIDEVRKLNASPYSPLDPILDRIKPRMGGWSNAGTADTSVRAHAPNDQKKPKRRGFVRPGSK